MELPSSLIAWTSFAYLDVLHQVVTAVLQPGPRMRRPSLDVRREVVDLDAHVTEPDREVVGPGRQTGRGYVSATSPSRRLSRPPTIPAW